MIRTLVMCFLLCLVSADTKPTVHKDRVHHQDPLSDLDHDDDVNHDFDHEAFLGPDEAKAFEQLEPDEAKRRLGIMVDRIDHDRDGFVSEAELRTWITAAQKKQLLEGLEDQWAEFNLNNDSVISWTEYLNASQAAYRANPEAGSEEDYKALVKKEERRFRAANQDGDMNADLDEFSAFLNPEEYPHMIGTVVTEIIEELDKNKDGFVDIDEFIRDVYVPVEDQEEPEWVSAERKDFTESRDINKDRHLDHKEVRAWIFPEDTDFIGEEVTHLIQESDSDEDGKLSKSEILEHHDVFVGSQDIGEALMQHDEF